MTQGWAGKETDRLLLLGWMSPTAVGQTPMLLSSRAPDPPALMVASVLMLRDSMVPRRLEDVPACTGWTWSHGRHHPSSHPKPSRGSQGACWDLWDHNGQAEGTGSAQGRVPCSARAGPAPRDSDSRGRGCTLEMDIEPGSGRDVGQWQHRLRGGVRGSQRGPKSPSH